MDKNIVIHVAILLSLFVLGCGSEQLVLWNLMSEKGEEIKIKVREEQNLFNKVIAIRIDGDEVIIGNGGKDKKNEYNAEYKGKTIKAYMLYNSVSNDEIVELIIDGKLVGEFVFPQKQ